MSYIKILGVEVITVRVGYKEILDRVTIYAVLQKMRIGVRGKIDQKIVVYKRLRPRADILAAKPPCLVAIFAVAEHRRKPLRRRSSKISELHTITAFSFIRPL
jgi:hypothetical protein